MSYQYYVYIVTNKPFGTLYIGVTKDLIKRIYEHKSKFVNSFSKKYSLGKLVYFEVHNDIYEAIKREKSLKKWRRKWKEELVEKTNPNWQDLYEQILS